ncbi:hypothetical protein AN639_11415 [Candidatus Epulonipiscium fishelsonii]|nr:hypothetical protein AN639_11415 [Epulopiscium sp. SCG-B05WGA-EpuloA1]
MLKYELKIKYKAFTFWSIGLILLFIAGSMEFEGISGANSESIEVVLNYYPPIILSLMGITEAIDFSYLDGYTWVLGYFGTVIASFYAITLGLSIVNREFIDKTFEFLFTKPRKRKYILSIKIFSGFICLTAFSLINLFSSTLIMNPLDENIDISNLMFLSSIGTYIVSLLFYAISIFVSVLVKNRRQSSKIINLFFLFSFVLGGIYDVTENAEILRFFTPLRYFLYEEANVGVISVWFLLISFVLSVFLIAMAYKSFNKRDLTEI